MDATFPANESGFMNRPPLTLALLALIPIALLAGGMTLLVMNGRTLYALAALAAACGGLLVLFPRMAFYLFIASLSFWVPQRLTATFAIHPFDLLMGVLIVGAALEFLLRPPLRRHPMLFDIPFLALATATIVSGILAFRPEYAVVPAIRIFLIYFAFRAMLKYSRVIGVTAVLKFYLLVVLLLSLYNVGLFVAHGGRIRAFGPALLGYESLSMTGMPMALAFGLWAEHRRERFRWLAAALVIALGIISTQARGPLLTIVLATPVLLAITWRKARKSDLRTTRRTIKWLLVTGLLMLVGIAGLSTTLLSGSWERYQEFVASANEPQGTIALRLTLWKMALDAFVDNPVTGIGAGNFRVVHELYYQVRLSELHRFVKGFSAHNVILHYLAETGLVGTLALLSLAFAGWRSAWRNFRAGRTRSDNQTDTALFIGMFVFVVSLFYMRAWTWGQGGYIMALLFALVAARADTRPGPGAQQNCR
jgi:O-antigen ligase